MFDWQKDECGSWQQVILIDDAAVEGRNTIEFSVTIVPS